MITYNEVILPHLSPDDQALFKPLIYPTTCNLFDPKEAQHQITLVAFAHDQPVGLIAAFAYPTVIRALLVAFFVKPDYQHQGIGRELMQRLLARLLPLGIKIVELHYNSWEESTSHLEQLLAHTGWRAPELLTRRYYFDPQTFHPSWYTASRPQLSSQYTLFPWEEATSEELTAVKNFINQNPKLSEISPFSEKYPLEKLNSLGLRSKEGLIGWMITHRLKPQLIRYSALYASPQIRLSGAPIALLKESIRRHIAQAKEALGLAEINFYRSTPHWRQFAQKRLGPPSCKIEEIKCAFHLTQE